MGALAGFEKEIDGGKEGTPQAKAHGAAQRMESLADNILAGIISGLITAAILSLTGW